MQARGLTQAAALPVRFAAIVVVWVTATLTLGLALGLPLLVFMLTVPVLLFTYVYARLHADDAVGAVRPSPAAALDDADELPGASFADHFVAKEFGAARRGRDVTLVMFGFSRFEEFAEREGSVAAGEALREFGRVLQKLTRQMNLTARYGWRADSFLSVLSDADAAAAERFIGRVRGAVAAAKVKMPEIDAGIAVYQPHLASPDEFVACAERALAEARAAALRAEQPNVLTLPSQRVPSRRADGAARPRARRVPGTSG